MEVISWRPRAAAGSLWQNDLPAVLTACAGGVCDKTEHVVVSKRDRKVREGLTEDQFKRMKAGSFWPELRDLMTDAQQARLDEVYGLAAAA
jgi:hypothetical protein